MVVDLLMGFELFKIDFRTLDFLSVLVKVAQKILKTFVGGLEDREFIQGHTGI